MTVTGNNTEASTKYKPSFYAGGFAEFNLYDNLYGEDGIQYVNNGFSINENGKNISASLSQLNVPLSVKYEVTEGLRVKGGLYAGYIMSLTIKSGNTSETYTGDDSTKEKERVDYGLSIGAEYALSNGMLIESNYNHGLKNIGKNEIDNTSLSNKVFQLGVGYRF